MANVYLQDENGNEIPLGEMHLTDLRTLRRALEDQYYADGVFNTQTAKALALKEAVEAVREEIEACTERKYKIIRMYYKGGRRTIDTKLTLRQARAHCNDPETSSSTATSAAAKAVTRRNGAWFDAYDEM